MHPRLCVPGQGHDPTVQAKTLHRHPTATRCLTCGFPTSMPNPAAGLRDELTDGDGVTRSERGFVRLVTLALGSSLD